MVSAFRGKVQNGQIRLKRDQELPEGTEVIVVVIEENDSGKVVSTLTGRELAESELVGLWANRKDIEDSAAYARQLREQAQRRGHATS